jgi:hypothetical protein
MEVWPNADPGSFVVEVPSPVHPERKLWVGTDGNEITVGFGEHGWHTHFGDWVHQNEAESFEAALEEIAAILSEDWVLAVGFREDGTPGLSILVPVCQDPKLGDYPRVEYFSWYGTHDRVVPA